MCITLSVTATAYFYFLCFIMDGGVLVPNSAFLHVLVKLVFTRLICSLGTCVFCVNVMFSTYKYD